MHDLQLKLSPITTRMMIHGMRLFLVAASVIVFGQVVFNGFIDFDDPLVVTDNEMVKGGISFRGLKWAWTTGHFANWMPLTWMSHQLDWQLYGDWAGGHHLTSLVLHIAATLLCFEAFRTMTWRLAGQAPSTPDATGESLIERRDDSAAIYASAIPSFAMALLWSIHPLHVESVAWIAERKGVLSNALGMLALCLYARHVHQPTRDSMGLVLVAFIGSLLSKQMWVTFPALLFLLWIWPLGAGLNKSERLAGWRETGPLWVSAAFFAAIAYFAQRGGGAVSSFGGIPIGPRLENAAASAVVYLRRFVWPSDLGPFYPHPLGTLEPIIVWGCAAALVLISIIAYTVQERFPYVTVGWFWFLVALLPVSGMIPVGRHGMADRYMDLPIVGLLMGVVWLTWTSMKRTPAFVALLAAVAVSLGTVSFIQARHWRSTRALFEHVVRVDPHNAMAQMQLAVEEARQGNLPAALEHAQAAVAADSDFAMAQGNLGIILRDLGELKQASASLERAGDLGEPRYYVEAARSKLALGEPARALELARQARSAGINGVDIATVEASSLLMLGRRDEGIAILEKVVREPDATGETHRLLGIALWQSGRPEARDSLVLACVADVEQLKYIERLVNLEVPDPRLVDYYASCLHALGRQEEAGQALRRALVLAQERGDEALAAEINVRLERGDPTSELKTEH